jgi:hypothetical protein
VGPTMPGKCDPLFERIQELREARLKQSEAQQ